MKSYTDLEQSKKLAEILPLESADMVYFGIHQGMDGKYYLSGTNTKDDVVPIYKNLCTKVFVKATKSDINCQLPCWSLAALLEQIPYEVCDDDGNSLYLEIHKEDNVYQLVYIDPNGLTDNIYTDMCEQFVDACYELIVKLNELNLL